MSFPHGKVHVLYNEILNSFNAELLISLTVMQLKFQFGWTQNKISMDFEFKVQVKNYHWNEPCLFEINSSLPGAAYMRQWIGSALVQIMACHLFDTKPLSNPVLGYCQLDP